MTQKDDLAGNKERNKLKLHQIFLHRQKKNTKKSPEDAGRPFSAFFTFCKFWTVCVFMQRSELL